MIRAVPKQYRGTLFRSTLEADWAATLDTYNVVWQYEPEAYQLPSGDLYRPDFYLPEIRTWLEVKGPHDERIEKPLELRWAVAHPTDCDQCDSIDHTGYRNPWRMVLIGRPADSNGILKAGLPGVSTISARCDECQRYQWTSWFRADSVCRFCGALDLNEWATIYELPNFGVTSGFKLKRAM